jgi:hypothetical protein
MVGSACAHLHLGGDFSVPQLPTNPVYTGLLGPTCGRMQRGIRGSHGPRPTAYNRDLVAAHRPDVDAKEGDFSSLSTATT